jgi:hypothetical protein
MEPDLFPVIFFILIPFLHLLLFILASSLIITLTKLFFKIAVPVCKYSTQLEK